MLIERKLFMPNLSYYPLIAAVIASVSFTIVSCGGSTGDSNGTGGGVVTGSGNAATDTGSASATVGGGQDAGTATNGATTIGGATTAANPSGNTGDAVGLSGRASLANFNLPIDGVRLGNYELVNAYPNLTFEEALLVDDVPGENRLVVVERLGKIKVFDDNPAATTAPVVLDYFDNLATTSGEQGLLGLAFDPRFAENRFVYIYHTQKGTNASTITRLRWDSATDKLDTSSAKIVLQVDQPYLQHNGGMLAFGPDNFLYIGLGDGGNGGDPLNNAQDRNTMLGSILRIDVNTPDSVPYVVPASNPFVGEANVKTEIYAHGFRNPWRFSFDRLTGDLWVGDVGQERHEEINKVKSGGNYGWAVYEGSTIKDANRNTLPESAFTPPIHEYTHDLGKSVTGGYVYRGAVSSLQGRYIYSDYSAGTVTALTLNGETVTLAEPVGTVDRPTSFGETQDGELLIVTYTKGLFKFAESTASLEFPATLSQTGLFSDLASLTPVSGFIEYAPSHPFWSDGTIKRRWIGVPNGSTIDFTADDWTFPIGSVSIKHFEFEQVQNSPESRRRLETRVMYNTLQGWQGFTYRWNAGETEANLITERQTEQLTLNLSDGTTRVQTYDYPSRADCSACHNDASTFLLGLETGQLNTGFAYPSITANQLHTFNKIGLFNSDIGATNQYKVLPPLTDENATIEQRARAYLDVNCSNCHQPNSLATTNMNLRVDTSNADMNAIDATPQSGSLDIADARIIARGSKERSVLWHRMRNLDETRMPPISTHVVDEAAVKLIGDWIDAL